MAKFHNDSDSNAYYWFYSLSTENDKGKTHHSAKFYHRQTVKPGNNNEKHMANRNGLIVVSVSSFEDGLEGESTDPEITGGSEWKCKKAVLCPIWDNHGWCKLTKADGEYWLTVYDDCGNEQYSQNLHNSDHELTVEKYRSGSDGLARFVKLYRSDDESDVYDNWSYPGSGTTFPKPTEVAQG